MNTLITAFASLAEDKQARKLALSSLITSNLLSSTEIRYLRDQLNAIPLNKDICGELPMEVLDMVVGYLDLEDVMVVSRVCRLWEKRFLTFERCMSLARVHLRKGWNLKWEHLLENEGGKENHSAGDFMEWFGKAARERVLREKHHYQSAAFYKLSIAFTSSAFSRVPRPEDWHVYCNGRIAYYTSPSAIVVHDLQSNEKKTYQTPGRVPIEILFLSDELLVTRDIGGSMLHAWILASSDRKPYSKTVPSRYSTHRVVGRRMEISVSEKRIGKYDSVSTPEVFRVYIWEVGGSMKESPHSPTNFDELLPSYPNPDVREDDEWRVTYSQPAVIRVECYKKGVVLQSDEVQESTLGNKLDD